MARIVLLPTLCLHDTLLKNERNGRHFARREVCSEFHCDYVFENMSDCLSYCGLPRVVTLPYTAKNATDVMQVVDFTGLMQFANKLYQAC